MYLLLAVIGLGSCALCKAADDPASAPAAARPFIGLLLPLEDPDFARPAAALQQGCQAALALANGTPALEVLRADATPARILSEYKAAVKRGAGAIVGPMIRSGVSALASSGLVSVPTIALNAPEGAGELPAKMEVIGLSIETESRAVARAARAEGLRDAIVVQAPGALATRAARAFADQWMALGGWISDTQAIGPGVDLRRLQQRMSRSHADLVFLAADAEHARMVLPYLGIRVFSISQVNDSHTDSRANFELNGVRFVDVPWLLQPDHPAVMIYPRVASLSVELQRFYALGIDACRVATERLRRHESFTLDGVTGRLMLKQGSQAEREPVQAMFRNGVAVALEPAQ